MNPLVLTGFLAFLLVALVVGVRLLVLWGKTGEQPELLIGIGVLCIGPVGSSTNLAGQLLHSDDPGTASVLFGVGAVVMAVGVVSKCVFNWQVYHPRSAFCGLLTGGLGAFLLGHFTVQACLHGFGPSDPRDPGVVSLGLIQAGILVWGAAESMRWWAMMRRRLRLGLGDAVVTNRFLMWGIGAGLAGGGMVLGLAASAVAGRPSLEMPRVVSLYSACGMGSAIALALAFVPPPAYLRWLRGDAASAA